MTGRKKTLTEFNQMGDILPQDQVYWNRIRQVINEESYSFGFSRIDTSFLEQRELLIKTINKGNNSTEKEFFNVTTKKRDKLVLRPDLMVSTLRACLENKLFDPLAPPVKLFSIGPVFSYEELPPLGKKQAYQANFQIIGGDDAILDAQLIQFFNALTNRLGLKKTIVQINCIGCVKCQANYRKSLLSYYRSRKEGLCPNCKNVLSQNPLRLIACQEQTCQELAEEAPQSIDFLCENCRADLRNLLEYLDELNIPYMLNFRLVGAFGYHARTVFEIQPEESEFSTFTLAEGGRCDKLVRFLGKRDLPVTGLTVNLESLIDLMRLKQIKIPAKKKDLVFLVQLGIKAKRKCLVLFDELRKLNIAVTGSFNENSMKPQLKQAEEIGARFVLILGQKEVMDESIIIRDMKSGIQELAPLAKVSREIKKKIKQQ